MQCQFLRRMPELEANILKLYQHASDVDTIDGLAWYPNAHHIICDWANTYRLPIATVACVTAALSPQLAWKRNLIIADDVLAGRPPSIGGCLNSCLRKAIRIRDNRATDTRSYFPQGPKVESFSRNLAGDYSIATVDTHMVQAALADVEATVTLRWLPYAVFSQCYGNVARTVGLEPAICQAILWHTWRRLYPRVTKIQRRRQWHVIGMED